MLLCGLNSAQVSLLRLDRVDFLPLIGHLGEVRLCGPKLQFGTPAAVCRPLTAVPCLRFGPRGGVIRWKDWEEARDAHRAMEEGIA